MWEDSQRYDIPEDLDGYEKDEIRRFNALRQEAAQDGNITTEEWRLAKNATRRAFYEEKYALLTECWSEFNTLDRGGKNIIP
jgi:hypothetical protein